MKKNLIIITIMLALLTGCTGSKSKESIYDLITDNLFVVNKDGKAGVMNTKGKLILNTEYSFISGFNSGLSVVAKGGAYDSNGTLQGAKFGVVNTKGKLVIPLKYDSLTTINKGNSFLAKADNKYFLIDNKGKTISKKYSYAEPFDSNIYLIGKNVSTDATGKMKGTFGLMNAKGKVIKKIQYQEITTLTYYPTVHNYIVKKDDHYGLIDKAGNTLLEIEYDNLESSYYGSYSDVNDCMILANKGSKTGAFDANGNKVLPLKYTYNSDSSNGGISYYKGVFIVYKNGKYGALNKKGNKIIDFDYQEIYGDQNNIIARNETDGLNSFTVYSLKGKKITDVKGQYLAGFSKKGTALLVNQSFNYVLIDQKGNVVKDFASSQIQADKVDSQGNYLFKYLDENYNTTNIELVDSKGNVLIGDLPTSEYTNPNLTYLKEIKVYLLTYQKDNSYYSRVYSSKGKLLKEYKGELIYGKYKHSLNDSESLYSKKFKGFILIDGSNYGLISRDLKEIKATNNTYITVIYDDYIVVNNDNKSVLLSYKNYSQKYRLKKGYKYGNPVNN